MDSETRRIPPSEWDHWKTTILGLTHTNTLNVVRARMKNEHGFNASRSQYETQLDIWKDRKNLKKEEWAEILEILDKLDSKHKKYRIFISGHPVTASRIQRARRYCRGESKNSISRATKGGHSTSLEDVRIETLGTDGRWTAYANLDDINDWNLSLNQAYDEILSLNIPCVDENAFGGTDPDTGDRQSSQVVDNYIDLFDIETTIPHQDLSYVSDSREFDVDIGGAEPLPLQPIEDLLFNQSSAIMQLPSQQGLPNSGDTNFRFHYGNLTNWTNLHNQLSSPVPLDLQNPPYYLLDDLPFNRFEQNLKTRGIDLTSQPANVMGAHVAPMLWNPVIFFLADVNSSLLENSENQREQRPIDATFLLSSFKSLLYREEFRGSDTRQGLITEDEMLQTNFIRLLVFSIANGFIGLQDVPIQSVLKHLSRYGDINSLLKGFLQANQSHVAKALTDNLFRAAIEAKDERTLKRLLAIGSVDVNDTVCIVKGKKYTPIERAARLQDPGIFELLLSAKADVNKTFALWPEDGGALGRLISAIDERATTTAEVFELIDLLLQANSKIHPQMLHQTLRNFTHTELAYRLFSRVSDSDHSELICTGLLSSIAKNFDDGQATEAIKKIILACQRMKCGTCLTRFQGKVDWALVQGAKRGHLQLVKLLLCYSKTPHRALSAAIRCGRSEVIDTVLTLEPDIKAPAHSIDEDWISEFGESFLRITTPLSEAIQAGNERLIHMLEAKGALDHLNEGRRFQPAIAAASNTGNISYVRKLLHHCPSPKPSHMSSAVLYSVQNDYEDIFWALLAAGADVNLHSTNSSSQTPLYAAISRRNPDMVRVLAKENIDLFKFLFEIGMVESYTLTRSLEVGISSGNAQLLQSLIDMGANPRHPDILIKCVQDCPKMLPMLLQQVPLRLNHHVMSGYGTGPLKAAIKQGLAGFETVKVFLDSGLVDTRGFGRYDGSGFDHESPLGLAIRVSRNTDHADFAVIRKLLDAGCNPNCAVTTISSGRLVVNNTGLLEAIETKSKGLVHLMISRGADVHQEASMGLKRTPLQKAAEVGSLEIVILILEAGADVNARPATRGGATALQLAAIGGNCNIAAKLMAHGADLQALPAEINGRWPLEGATEHGRLEMIEFLWKMNIAGFDREQCQRAMKLAEENGHMACKTLIMELLRTNVASVPVIGQEGF